MNDTLFIIGNGKSFNPQDLSKLASQETMGVNLGYHGFLQYSFCPTYHTFLNFDPHGHKRAKPEEVRTYINNSNVKKFFALKSDEAIFTGTKNLQLITLIENVNYKDVSNAYPPIANHVDLVLRDVDRTPEIITRIQIIKNNKALWALNDEGLKKFLLQDDTNFNQSDYILKPRIFRQYLLPDSFDRFYWQPEYNSCILCVLVGILLGYKRFILLGVDSKYIIRDKLINYDENYWFSGGTVDLTKSEVRNDYFDIFIDAWSILLVALALNQKNVELINTSIGSPLSNLLPTKKLSEIL